MYAVVSLKHSRECHCHSDWCLHQRFFLVHWFLIIMFLIKFLVHLERAQFRQMLLSISC